MTNSRDMGSGLCAVNRRVSTLLTRTNDFQGKSGNRRGYPSAGTATWAVRQLATRTGQPGRFIWQLVGVLATKDGNSLTGASVMPVFSGL